MTGEKIRPGKGEDAPLVHETRDGHGGARRMAERPAKPAEASEDPFAIITAPLAPAIISDALAKKVQAALDRLDEDNANKVTRGEFSTLKEAARSSLSAHEWAQSIGDELGRITSELNMGRASVLDLRARVLGLDPDDLPETDKGATDDESDRGN